MYIPICPPKGRRFGGGARNKHPPPAGRETNNASIRCSGSERQAAHAPVPAAVPKSGRNSTNANTSRRPTSMSKDR